MHCGWAPGGRGELHAGFRQGASSSCRQWARRPPAVTINRHNGVSPRLVVDGKRPAECKPLTGDQRLAFPPEHISPCFDDEINFLLVLVMPELAAGIKRDVAEAEILALDEARRHEICVRRRGG